MYDRYFSLLFFESEKMEKQPSQFFLQNNISEPNKEGRSECYTGNM